MQSKKALSRDEDTVSECKKHSKSLSGIAFTFIQQAINIIKITNTTNYENFNLTNLNTRNIKIIEED